MSGPKENLGKGWPLIRKGLDIEPPVPIGVYLGCSHEDGTMKIGDITARTMTYNMEDSCLLVLNATSSLPGTALS